MSPYFKRIVGYSAIGVLLLCLFFIERQPLVHYASNVIAFEKEYSNAKDDMLQVVRQEIFSPPIHTAFTDDKAELSPGEVVRITNERRGENDLPPLLDNPVLDKAADTKLQDMFDNQYFEHISPKGVGPGSLAAHAGYSYVIIGENLAMGTFESNDALLNAWMSSPGHRANILNSHYEEIGVAVGRGMYNGQHVLIAVQEFGKPTSACPHIDSKLKTSIENDKKTVATMQMQVTQQKKELDAMNHDTPEESASYNEKISAYNDFVSSYNVQVANLKSEIDTYNKEVRSFNACAQK